MKRRVKQLYDKVVYLADFCNIAETAEPLEVLLNGFNCSITPSTLRAVPVDDYEDAAEAHSVLQPCGCRESGRVMRPAHTPV